MRAYAVPGPQYRVAVVFRRRHFRSQPAFTRDSQQQLPMSTTAFEDSESLGEAWHAVGSFGNSLAALANGQMLMLLQNNPEVALRCARSPPEFFFGPTKELLHEVALQLRAAWIRQRWQRAARKAALLSLCLKEANARAIERMFAPGGTGFMEAHESFQAAAQTL